MVFDLNLFSSCNIPFSVIVTFVIFDRTIHFFSRNRFPLQYFCIFRCRILSSNAWEQALVGWLARRPAGRLASRPGSAHLVGSWRAAGGQLAGSCRAAGRQLAGSCRAALPGRWGGAGVQLVGSCSQLAGSWAATSLILTENSTLDGKFSILAPRFPILIRRFPILAGRFPILAGICPILAGRFPTFSWKISKFQLEYFKK